MRKALPESQAQSDGGAMNATSRPQRSRGVVEASFSRTWARRLGVVAIALGAIGSATGCAVSESDVHRWESTVRGPYKLVAVVTHDKYSLPLRIEAAMSLLRMPPRGGRRMGIAYLCDKYKDDDLNDTDGALASISEDSRKKIVDGLVPLIIAEIQKPPPGKGPDGKKVEDPSVPFKDAAFAMLSHEPSLISDPKTKADIVAALSQWVQTDFENRVDNSAQQYGVEQIMRFPALGAQSVRSLPGLINENSGKVDKIASLVADLGDADTKQKASEALVALAKKIDSQAWYDKQKAMTVEMWTKEKATFTPDSLAKVIKELQDQELTKTFGSMKRIGLRPVIDYCLGYASNPNASKERRQAALAALENKIDKNNAADIDKIFAIAKDDNAPDEVRDQAFARLGELPKELIVNRLYSLFDAKKWKGRWEAGGMILKTMTTKDVPDFLKHLPTSAATKMGMTEGITYGSLIMKMDAPAGAPKPKDLVNQYLGVKDLGAKLTALGAYYGGSKADVSRILPYESDTQPVPKCDANDECGWTCEIPKPGSQDTEQKTIVTVGDFAKYCVVPSMTGK